MIRILIASDRQTDVDGIAGALVPAGDMRVVAVAHDGDAAARLARILMPDVVIMAADLPGGPGPALADRIRANSQAKVIVLVDPGASESAAAALDALGAGAVDVVVRPRALGMSYASYGRKTLGDLVRSCATEDGGRVASNPELFVISKGRLPDLGRPDPSRVPRPLIVAIAASTGGPPALAELLSRLPAGWSVPVVIAQHLCAEFDRYLARWLDSVVPGEVVVAQRGERLEPGRIYLSPVEESLTVVPGGRVRLVASNDIHRASPSADLLFESVAEVYGASAVGIVLTGMGDDGARGLKAIASRGGTTIVQDPETCVVTSMPLRALEMSMGSSVLSLADIAASLLELVAAPGQGGA